MSQVKTSCQVSESEVKMGNSATSASSTSTNPFAVLEPYVIAVRLYANKVYETVPSRTMKLVGGLAVILLLVGVLSLTLAQKEETKDQYGGITFPLENAESFKDEKQVAPAGSIPGEGAAAPSESTSEPPVTSAPLSTEEPVTVAIVDDEKKDEDDNSSNEPTVLITGDEEDRSENGDEPTNPRLVFIERLMGLHLSAPMGEENKDSENESSENSAPQNSLPLRNAIEKLNAKWASRMRKFSIPIVNQEPPQEQPNPLLRYAAAAMMSRLLAAAARAHNQPEAKDKDDESEEDNTVPVLLATMRSAAEAARNAQISRPLSPMYGRPMTRPPISIHMRPPMRPPMAYGQPEHQVRMVSNSMPHRAYAAPQVVPQRPMNTMMHRALPPVQPVLVMLAHVPMPMHTAESRMGSAPVAPNSYYATHPPMPYYPQVPYAVPYGYHGYHQAPPRPVAMPVEVPVHVPVASYHRPVYQSPYHHQHYPQRQPAHMQAAYSHVRPVIEIPIEIPIPVHVPVPVNMPSKEHDHDASASEADQVAIVYYDTDGQDGHEHEDHMEPHASESRESYYRSAVGPKGHPYLSRPLPDIQSAAKLKLWREQVSAKHAAQPGVRYVPVAIATDESHQQTGHNSQTNDGLTESQAQPAFVILTDDGAEEQSPENLQH